MSLKPLDRERLTSIPFGELNGYEKGAVTRAFLNNLIKQGYLDSILSDNFPGEVSFLIHQWQLELLARFSEDGDPTEGDDDKEILLNKLCQLR